MSVATLAPTPTSPPTPRRTPAPAQFVFVCFLVGLGAWAALAQHAFLWTPPLLAVLPLAAAWAVRRRSLITSIYLAQLAVYFGISPLIVGSDWGRVSAALVVVWTAAVTLGTLAVSRKPIQDTPRVWHPPGVPHFAVGVLLLVVQAALTLSSRSGYRAQITTGQTTPTGLAGFLSTISPTIAILILITAVSSRRRVALAVALNGAQGLVLALSGFRGIGFSFILAVAYVAATLLPKDSPWRRQRLIVVVPTLIALIVVTFVIGARVKNQAANEQHVTNSGTQLFGLRDAARQVATRLDYGYELSHAVAFAEDHNLREAVKLQQQLQAGIPRFLWPGKPPVDYGQQVSVAAYGLRYGQSSSFLTDVGDQYVNFKTPGVVIGGFILGLALCAAERGFRKGRGLPSVVFGAALGYNALTGQATIILTTVALVRAFAIATILWAAAEWFRARRDASRERLGPAIGR